MHLFSNFNRRTTNVLMMMMMMMMMMSALFLCALALEQKNKAEVRYGQLEY